MTTLLPTAPLRIATLGAAALLGLSGSLRAQDWVQFIDVTSTRLQLSTVSVNDTEEKDFETGDFDQDGDLDVIVMRKTPFTFAGARDDVLLMNENGVLVDRTLALCPDFANASDTRDCWAFDYDNDGWLDFVTATTFSEVPRLYRNLGMSGGSWQGFANVVGWTTTTFSPTLRYCAVSSGDIDNDGDQDLFFSNYQTATGDRLLVNNGNGTFTDSTFTRIAGGLDLNFSFGTQNYIKDVNGDGWADIVRIGGLFDTPQMLINNGAGSFDTQQALPSGAIYQTNVNDFDNDGDLDLYICDDGQDYVYFNQGTNANGTIQTQTVGNVSSPLTTGFNHHNHAIDIDHDGFLDIGMADVDVDISGCNGQFTIVRNRLSLGTGQRGFYDAITPAGTRPWQSFGTYDFAWIDLNGDTYMDMIHGTCSGYRVFLQDASQFGPGEDFCFGDGGTGTCTPCPCFNEAPTAAKGGCENSSGTSARLVGSGTASVTNDSLRFDLTGANPSTFAVLISAANQLPQSGTCAPGSGVQSPVLDGLRCVGGALLRHGTRPIAADGSVGATTNPWGPPAGPAGGLIAQGGFTSGQTRNFQVFYREFATLGCMTGQNTSNGYSVQMLP